MRLPCSWLVFVGVLSAAPVCAQDNLVLPSQLTASTPVPFAGSTPEPYRASTRLAVIGALGPVLDGVSTWVGMREQGPAVWVDESNPMFSRLFGSNVRGSEILAFKLAQAGLTAWLIKHSGERGPARYLAGVSLSQGIVAGTLNVRNWRQARRLNAAYTYRW